MSTKVNGFYMILLANPLELLVRFGGICLSFSNVVRSTFALEKGLPGTGGTGRLNVGVRGTHLLEAERL